jgi:hypothetical protein
MIGPLSTFLSVLLVAARSPDSRAKGLNGNWKSLETRGWNCHQDDSALAGRFRLASSKTSTVRSGGTDYCRRLGDFVEEPDDQPGAVPDPDELPSGLLGGSFSSIASSLSLPVW